MNELKEQFRIGRLAQQLGIKRFVIRFWEKEFGIQPSRTIGGQRFYSKKDFQTFKLIKELLYEKGFTIAGAKKILESNHNDLKVKSIKVIGSTKDQEATVQQKNIAINSNLSEQIIALQKQLLKLRELL